MHQGAAGVGADEEEVMRAMAEMMLARDQGAMAAAAGGSSGCCCGAEGEDEWLRDGGGCGGGEMSGVSRSTGGAGSSSSSSIGGGGSSVGASGSRRGDEGRGGAHHRRSPAGPLPLLPLPFRDADIEAALAANGGIAIIEELPNDYSEAAAVEEASAEGADVATTARQSTRRCCGEDGITTMADDRDGEMGGTCSPQHHGQPEQRLRQEEEEGSGAIGDASSWGGSCSGSGRGPKRRDPPAGRRILQVKAEDVNK